LPDAVLRYNGRSRQILKFEFRDQLSADAPGRVPRGLRDALTRTRAASLRGTMDSGQPLPLLVDVTCHVHGAEARRVLNPDRPDRTFSREFLAREFFLEADSARIFHTDGPEVPMYWRGTDYAVVLFPSRQYYIVGELDNTRLTTSRTDVPAAGTTEKPRRQHVLDEVFVYKQTGRYPPRLDTIADQRDRAYAKRAFRKRAAGYELETVSRDATAHLVRVKVRKSRADAFTVLTDDFEVRACTRARTGLSNRGAGVYACACAFSCRSPPRFGASTRQHTPAATSWCGG
jgi:hypothetical protein